MTLALLFLGNTAEKRMELLWIVAKLRSTPACFRTRQPPKDHRGVDLISDALPFGRLWQRARIVFDCRMANDPATINKQSTNENNTDVDR
jgi:hypothetical protein